MINQNITLAFENCKLGKRPALLTYIVAGDSNKKMTLDILKSISPFVDICEIGIPTTLLLQMANKFKTVLIAL